MSAFRVIIRIVPLTNSQSSFEPVPFSTLTDGNPKNINVINFTEATSGISYRIERVEDIQSVSHGETLESTNQAYTEKLKGMGFIQVQSNIAVPNTFDKSFKVCLPEVVSLTNGATSSSSANSLTLSLVKNVHQRKNLTQSKIFKRNINNGVVKTKLKAKASRQMKKKRFKNSQVSKSKSALQKTEDDDSQLQSKRKLDELCENDNLLVETQLNDSESLGNGNGSDMRTKIKRILGMGENFSGLDSVNNSLDDELAQGVAKAMASITNFQQNENFSLDCIRGQSNSCNQMDSFQIPDDDVSTEVSTVYVVSEDDPLYDILEPFKNYFLKGECLICGFEAPEVNYNASEHMREHISTEESFSYYKCACCSEQFCSPRNLYDHVLRENKSYNYTCDVCCLKFKRKYQFLKHSANAHKDSVN